jgi:16S rRNA (adenine1518-N6/adenine1519-N6)-dimethyltransferase
MTRRPKKSLGQHFLTDVATAWAMIDAGRVTEGTPVLEIGPGKGFLTRDLIAAGATVTAVEKDRELAAELLQNYAGQALTVIEADFLTVDLSSLPTPNSGGHHDPPLQISQLPTPSSHVLVGNLPYNVGMAILVKALEHRELWTRIVFMFQLEVALRLCANPGIKAYGIPSLIVRLTHQPTLVRRLPPGAFFPPPKVDSGVVLLEPLTEPLLTGADRSTFLNFAGAAFRFRRKQAANALGRAAQQPAAWFADVLQSLDLSPTCRLEEIPVEKLVQVWRTTTSETH